MDYTQTITTAVYCPDTPANTFMETSVTFANDISKDFVGQYYGFDTDVFDFVQETSRNYRKAVFAVLDVISADSLAVMGGQHLSSPILSLSTRLNVTTREFWATSITYLNGTFLAYDDTSMGLASIYNSSVYNLAAAVTNAVHLDLGNVGPQNIFIDPSAVNDTFLPNLAPPGVNPNLWVREDHSFYYGGVVAPYQTFAQMLRAGLPQNITLGDLSDLPGDSQMVAHALLARGDNAGCTPRPKTMGKPGPPRLCLTVPLPQITIPATQA
ncbi:hypothetical protein FRC10_003548 [Ceratobasidium sp. 414]|nr:hypothetical protein FRC10_003548 [Ceratobasidium sp. 414]